MWKQKHILSTENGNGSSVPRNEPRLIEAKNTPCISSQSSGVQYPCSEVSKLIVSPAVHRRISSVRPYRKKATDDETAVDSCDQRQPFSLSEYIYQRGFLEGLKSDITIACFNREYKLHAFIISRSPYFASLVDECWTAGTSLKEGKPNVLVVDFKLNEHVTVETVDLVLARLYGNENPELEKQHVNGLITVANFLDLPDIVASCVQQITRNINASNVVFYSRFSHEFDYGRAGREIFQSCRTFLYTEGYDLGLEVWVDVPSDVAAEVITSDKFYVPSEWDRVQLLILVYGFKVESHLDGTEERYRTNELTAAQTQDLLPLRNALNEKIYYCHMTHEQLKLLEGLKDNNGLRLISPNALRQALWLQNSLRSKILNAPTSCQELGISNKASRQSTAPPGKCQRCITKEKNRIRDRFISQAMAGESDFSDSSREASDDECPICDEHPKQPYASTSFVDDLGLEGASLPVYDIPPSQYDFLQEHQPNVSVNSSRQDQNTYKTKFPPFRFSVLFKNVWDLQKDRHIFSKAFLYAGSFWCVNIQKVVDKNGVRLGVYLHRCTPDLKKPCAQTSLKSGIDASEGQNSSDEGPEGASKAEGTEIIGSKTDLVELLDWKKDSAVPSASNDKVAGVASSPLSSSGSQSTSSKGEDEDGDYDKGPIARLFATTPTPLTYCVNPSATFSPGDSTNFDTEAGYFDERRQPRFASTSESGYIDERYSISTYFEMYTPSACSSVPLKSFSSPPETFNFSQSWGWTSQDLVGVVEDLKPNNNDDNVPLEDDDGNTQATVEGPSSAPHKPGGLKIVVILGLI